MDKISDPSFEITSIGLDIVTIMKHSVLTYFGSEGIKLNYIYIVVIRVQNLT